MLDIYRPQKNERPGTAIVSPYPFAGNRYNSAARLQAVADLTHTVWIGIQRPGTDTTVFDPGMQQSLRPAQYSRTVADLMDGLRADLDELGGEFDVLMGNGESGGGVLIMALALLGMFSRIMLRNAINNKAPQHTLPGMFNFASHLVLSKLHRTADYALPDDLPSPYSRYEKIRQGITEIRHYHPLMLSEYTRGIAEVLALNPRLPIQYVDTAHTFTGSAETNTRFAQRLVTARAAMASYSQQANPMFRAAELRAKIEPVRHSDLLSPMFVARHAKEMFELQGAAA